MTEGIAMLRKHIIPTAPHAAASGTGLKPDGLHVPALATVLVTSESPDHPVDHLFDGHDGPGGTRWVASVDGEQALILAFDTPQTIREVAVETEELYASRTQVLTLSLSQDEGRTYREILRQEFNFSPPGTTFERERWSVAGARVTHLRVAIQPDKGGAPCRATLTSLAIR
jgi:hypothetical protein